MDMDALLTRKKLERAAFMDTSGVYRTCVEARDWHNRKLALIAAGVAKDGPEVKALMRDRKALQARGINV